MISSAQVPVWSSVLPPGVATTSVSLDFAPLWLQFGLVKYRDGAVREGLELSDVFILQMERQSTRVDHGSVLEGGRAVSV